MIRFGERPDHEVSIGVTTEFRCWEDLSNEEDWREIIELADVWMIESSNRLRLALEAFAELRGGHFDRDVPV